jgi:hypothetical protein
MKDKTLDPVIEMRKRELDSLKTISEVRRIMDHHTADAHVNLRYFFTRVRRHIENPDAWDIYVPGKDTPQVVCTLLTRWPQCLRYRLDPVFYKLSSTLDTTRSFEQLYADIEEDLYRGFEEVHTLSMKLPRVLRGWARVGKYLNVYDEHMPNFFELFDWARKTIFGGGSSASWA